MEFYIIEDEERDLEHISALFRRLLPSAIFRPDKVFSTWDEVHSAVKAETIDNDALFLVVDLAIPSKKDEVERGVAEAYRLKLLRPKATFIAHTTFPGRAQAQPHFDDVFKENIINKQTFANFKTLEDEAKYVQGILTRPLGDRAPWARKTHPTASLRDSLGLRLFEAVFGKDTFDAIVSEIVPDWERIMISAPSQGYSGTFVISLTGTKEGRQQGCILKFARDAKSLEDEIKAADKYLSELGEFAGVLCKYKSTTSQLRDLPAYYYEQASVSGKPLLDVLMEHGWDGDAQASLHAIVGLEEKHLKTTGLSGCSKEPPSVFKVGELDKQRVYSSIELIESIAQHVAADGTWPDGVPQVPDVCSGVIGLVEKWGEKIERTESMFHVVQHGDLHPRNVLVPEPGRVVLIDPARLKPWPVGYDLSRLATMLRVRLVDSRNHHDWVNSDIRAWGQEAFCNIDAATSPDSSLCPSAVYCDQAFRRIVEFWPSEHRETLRRGYRLGTLWDLIKVMSYQDLSPFKKVYAMLACWRLAKEIGYL